MVARQTLPFWQETHIYFHILIVITVSFRVKNESDKILVPIPTNADGVVQESELYAGSDMRIT